MKKRLLSLFCAFALVMGLLPATALAANEVDWAADAVTTLNGIYGANVFSADDGQMTEGNAASIAASAGWTTSKVTSGSTAQLTRCKACEVLADVFDLPVPESKTAIKYLYEQNIVNGKSPDNLAETDPVTKAEFAVLTYRVLNAVGGGMGSSTELKPGTEEYFAWMYLGARMCVKFEDADTGGNISQEVWNGWVTELQKLPTDTPLSGFTAQYPNDSQTVTKLEAAVEIVDKYIQAGGSSTIFSDVPTDSPYYDGVTYLFDHGIILGNGDGTFAPEQALSRQQLAVLLYRYGETDKPQTGDNEIPAAMTYAQDNKYLTPPADGADDWWQATATREEAIVAIVKACAKAADVENANTDVLDRFEDGNAVSDDAAPYIAYAVSIGILNGNQNGTLGLSTGATRGQAGVLLYRTLIGLDTSKMHDYALSVDGLFDTSTGTGGVGADDLEDGGTVGFW